jgi:hypothetical protein
LGMLAEQARRKPSTISKSADSLVRRGLLTRAEVAADRRAMVLALTPAGRQLLAEGTAALSRLAVLIADAAPVSYRELSAFTKSVYETTKAWLPLPVGRAGRWQGQTVTRRRPRSVPGPPPVPSTGDASALAAFPAGAGSARPSPPGRPSPAGAVDGVRRSTATSCRSTRSSASLEAGDRPSRTSQPQSRTKMR